MLHMQYLVTHTLSCYIYTLSCYTCSILLHIHYLVTYTVSCFMLMGKSENGLSASLLTYTQNFFTVTSRCTVSYYIYSMFLHIQYLLTLYIFLLHIQYLVTCTVSCYIYIILLHIQCLVIYTVSCYIYSILLNTQYLVTYTLSCYIHSILLHTMINFIFTLSHVKIQTVHYHCIYTYKHTKQQVEFTNTNI